jgi:hypothetical protein
MSDGTTPFLPRLGQAVDDQLDQLLDIRRSLARVRSSALSPAVARALEMADIELFLAMGYLGYRDQLFPEQ